MDDEQRSRSRISDHDRKRDLILAPNEYAYVSDETNGQISVYVGPKKTSLESTVVPVIFDYITKQFRKAANIEEAKQTFCIAPEGWYIILKNPAHDRNSPEAASTSTKVDLEVGKKVNMPGPTSFPLWPGQMAKVVKGHHLRSNQYILARCYDEIAAKASWEEGIVKPATDEDTPQPDSAEDHAGGQGLTTGKLMVIRGTDVSFYIPPTGIEVVTEKDSYIRQAVTLERLEYCILLDEDGNKRYVRGPAVVFPKPTETFIERNGARKFTAIELNQISGVYIKVIADYQEGEGDDVIAYKAGDELFITGDDTPIYFPREEHATIKYGDQEVHYATAIPAGETRYLMDRLSGVIELIEGPEMLLPDPRAKVLVRRVLEPKHVSLWYPGNEDALKYNRNLLRNIEEAGEGEDYISEQSYRSMKGWDTDTPVAMAAMVSDEFSRKETYTKPRTVTLDTKYEGAPKIQVWTGYAVNVISDTGERRVVEGPATVNLQYDEFLEAMELSTGTPKNADRKMKTAYLRVKNNKVSDIVNAETKDLCNVQVTLSYRVNFEGDPEKWFDVEDYVGFLTDHMRSMIRNLVKQHGVEDFYGDSINIIRDAILGRTSESGRVGRLFTENIMRITDVEVLGVTIGDKEISSLLQDAEIEAVHQSLRVARQQRELELRKASEMVKQETATVVMETTLHDLGAVMQIIQKEEERDLRDVKHTTAVVSAKKQAELEKQEVLDKIQEKELARELDKEEQDLYVERKEQELELEELQAKVKAFVDQQSSIQPELTAALQTLGDQFLTGKLTENMSVQAILGGKSVSEVVNNLLKGTLLGNKLDGDILNRIAKAITPEEE